MVKTFIAGIVSGILIGVGLLYLIPAVNQHRETSLISVQPNGGNTESFHVNLPDDRIMKGSSQASPFPATLEWPAAMVLGDTQTELFKIRNRNDVVVGVASRITGTGTESGSMVEWTLHLPARGTLYASLQPQPDEAGRRSGRLRAGTREFFALDGSINERYIGTKDSSETGSNSEGRIELVTALAGTLESNE